MFRLIKNFIYAALLIVLVASLSRNIFLYKDKLSFYHDYRTEYEKENELNKKLKSDIKKSEDYYYVEKEIREKLNLLQPGETSLIIPEVTLTPEPTPAVPKAPYQEWLELYINR
jgi:cell division protein FtsB